VTNKDGVVEQSDDRDKIGNEIDGGQGVATANGAFCMRRKIHMRRDKQSLTL
jgi:hypothetical protein